MSVRLPAVSRDQLRFLSGLAVTVALALLFVFVLRPLRAREALIRAQLDEQVAKNKLALENVRQIAELEQQTARLAEALAVETNRFVLRPVLGSFPAQREIYRLAADTLFKVAMVRDVGKRPTPTEVKPVVRDVRSRSAATRRPTRERTPPPAPAFARYVVEVSGEGSYADVFALIESIERDNPYCGVTDLNIRGIPSTPERHRVTMTLEWPVLADAPPAADKTATSR